MSALFAYISELVLTLSSSSMICIAPCSVTFFVSFPVTFPFAFSSDSSNFVDTFATASLSISGGAVVLE